MTEQRTPSRTPHPVACHCHAQGTDDTCPSRWNGLIGATNCPSRRPHRGHPWVGTHPWSDGAIRMRCRGGESRLSLRFAWYDLWVGAFYDRAKRTLYVCPLPTMLITWRLPQKAVSERG